MTAPDSESWQELLREVLRALPFAAGVVGHDGRVLAGNEQLTRHPPASLLRNPALLARPIERANAWLVFESSAAPSNTERCQLAARAWGLTGREQQVLAELLDGASRRAVAARLGIGVRTVDTHVQRLFAKSSCESRSELLVRVLATPLEPLAGPVYP